MRTFSFALLCFICWHFSFAQQLPIGGWSIHLNYTHINTVLKVEDKIYVGTQTGLFSYDIEEGSTITFSKLDNLSSTNVTALSFNQEEKVLIVGYNNGEIDILKNNNVINIPDIEMASIYSGKTIQHIYSDNELAYLSCPFGLVVLNTEKYEINETYYFSENGNNAQVFASYVFNDDINCPADEFLANKIFAATDKGLYYADKDGQLHIPSEWKKDSRIISGLNYNASDFEIKKLVGIDFGPENGEPHAGGKTLVIGIDIDDSSSLNENLFSFYKAPYEAMSSDPISELTNCFVPVDNGSNGNIYDVRFDIDNSKLISTAGYSWQKNTSIIELNPSNTQSHFGGFDKISIAENSTDAINSPSNINTVLLDDDYINSNKIFIAHNKEGIFSATIQNDEIKHVENMSPNGPVGTTNGAIASNGQNIIFTINITVLL